MFSDLSILKKKKCKNFDNCWEKENSDHNSRFYHLCDEGKNCEQIKKEYHLNRFVHPCPKNHLCNDNSEIHLIRFVHDSKKSEKKITLDNGYGSDFTPDKEQVGNGDFKRPKKKRKIEENSKIVEKKVNKTELNVNKIGNKSYNINPNLRKKEMEDFFKFKEEDEVRTSKPSNNIPDFDSFDPKRYSKNNNNNKDHFYDLSKQYYYKFRKNRANIQYPSFSKGLFKHVPMPFNDRRVWKIIQNIQVENIKDFNTLRAVLGDISGRGVERYCRLNDAIFEFGRNEFYKKLLPFLIKVLKGTKKMFNGEENVKLLPQNENGKCEIERKKVFVIIVNAFFSTFQFYKKGVRGNDWKRNKYALQVINFKKLFNHEKKKSIVSKIVFFLHYFNRGRKKILHGNIIVERRSIYPDFSIFRNSKRPLNGVTIKKTGTIEEKSHSLQIDFANMRLGGGVLGKGAVQEEIRFCINPECIFAMLICPCMLDHESIVISGTEQFAKYKGYAKSLEFGGDFIDKNVGNYDICAIDALNVSRVGRMQYRKDLVNREIWKAYVGFSGGSYKDISTGNWGCGAFKGNKELKFIIQWIAASQTSKHITYYTFNDKSLSKKLNVFQKEIKLHKIGVKHLYNAVLQLNNHEIRNNTNIFDLIVKLY